MLWLNIKVYNRHSSKTDAQTDTVKIKTEKAKHDNDIYKDSKITGYFQFSERLTIVGVRHENE